MRETRWRPLACSAMVLIQWQVVQTACPLSVVSVPPSAHGVMWSAWVALRVQPVPLIWHVQWSRSMMARRMGGGNVLLVPPHDVLAMGQVMSCGICRVGGEFDCQPIGFRLEGCVYGQLRAALFALNVHYWFFWEVSVCQHVHRLVCSARAPGSLAASAGVCG